MRAWGEKPEGPMRFPEEAPPMPWSLLSRSSVPASASTDTGSLEQRMMGRQAKPSYIVIRDGEPFCKLCNKWSSKMHLESKLHMKRAQYPEWYLPDDFREDLIVVSDEESTALGSSGTRESAPLPSSGHRCSYCGKPAIDKVVSGKSRYCEACWVWWKQQGVEVRRELRADCERQDASEELATANGERKGSEIAEPIAKTPAPLEGLGVMAESKDSTGAVLSEAEPQKLLTSSRNLKNEVKTATVCQLLENSPEEQGNGTKPVATTARRGKASDGDLDESFKPPPPLGPPPNYKPPREEGPSGKLQKPHRDQSECDEGHRHWGEGPSGKLQKPHQDQSARDNGHRHWGEGSNTSVPSSSVVTPWHLAAAVLHQQRLEQLQHSLQRDLKDLLEKRERDRNTLERERSEVCQTLERKLHEDEELQQQQLRQRREHDIQFQQMLRQQVDLQQQLQQQQKVESELRRNLQMHSPAP